MQVPHYMEAPYGFGIMEPYYGPKFGFMPPPETFTHQISLPFCKVCRDAGKSLRDYHSHFVRETADKNSKIVCPTLLSQKCRYCKKYGHTIKYCKRLASKEKRRVHYRDCESSLSTLSSNDEIQYDYQPMTPPHSPLHQPSNNKELGEI